MPLPTPPLTPDPASLPSTFQSTWRSNPNPTALPFLRSNPPFPLTPTDWHQLSLRDADFTPHSWANLQHLISTQQLEALTRWPSQLKAYLAWTKHVKEKYGSVMAYLLKPKPDGWDSEFDGSWADQPAALVRSDNEGAKDDSEGPAIVPPKKNAPRGRGKATGSTRQIAAAPKKAAPVVKAGRGGKSVAEEEEEEDNDGDVVMVSDDDEESAEDLFVRSSRKVAPAKKTAAKATTRAGSPKKRTTASRMNAPATTKQSTLNFSQSSAPRNQPKRPAASRVKKAVEPSDDEISDDDAFDPPAPTARNLRTSRK